MKPGRRSNKRLAQAFQRRILGRSGHASVKTIRGEVARKQASNTMDFENLLHLSQQLYAHALTLQAVIRNQGQITYEVLRPRFDRQAAQQFEIFYHSASRRPGSRTASFHKESPAKNGDYTAILKAASL